MERKIGEIFEYNGEWYQCVESDSCGECSLFTTECGSGTKSDLADKVFGQCSKVRRTDNKHVIFKKLEKVGEPITVNGKNVQLLKTTIANCDNCAFYKDVNCDFTCYPRKCHGGEEGTYVEIKQTKEDMEEKKLNLKPFDIQKAREGKPVCTRDGRKARIICFDSNGCRPIVALVTECDDEEEIPYKYHCDGSYNCQSIPSDNDLMMLPEKKEGWVNVYKGGLLDTKSYPTKKEAFDKACPEGYVDTVKVCWEE